MSFIEFSRFIEFSLDAIHRCIVSFLEFTFHRVSITLIEFSFHRVSKWFIEYNRNEIHRVLTSFIEYMFIVFGSIHRVHTNVFHRVPSELEPRASQFLHPCSVEFCFHAQSYLSVHWVVLFHRVVMHRVGSCKIGARTTVTEFVSFVDLYINI